jgi:hypothetical protein
VGLRLRLVLAPDPAALDTNRAVSDKVRILVATGVMPRLQLLEALTGVATITTETLRYPGVGPFDPKRTTGKIIELLKAIMSFDNRAKRYGHPGHGADMGAMDVLGPSQA